MSETLTAFLSFFLFIPLYYQLYSTWVDGCSGWIAFVLFSLFLSLFSKLWIKSKPKSVGGADNLSFSLLSLFLPGIWRPAIDGNHTRSNCCSLIAFGVSGWVFLNLRATVR